MPLVEIDCAANSSAILAKHGLKIHSLRGRVSIHPEMAFEAPTTVIPTLTLDAPTQVGAFCSLSSAGKIGFTEIGRYCSIAEGVVTGAHGHPTDWLTTSRITYLASLHNWHKYCAPDRVSELLSKRRPAFDACPKTYIGNDVWIGQGVFIKSGVRIGDGAIVAARAVVVKDVPPYSIVGGSPAKVIRMRFPEPIIERLLAIRWWRFSLYDMYDINFEQIDRALDQIEERVSAGQVEEYKGRIFRAEDLKSILESPTSKNEAL